MFYVVVFSSLESFVITERQVPEFRGQAEALVIRFDGSIFEQLVFEEDFLPGSELKWELVT